MLSFKFATQPYLYLNSAQFANKYKQVSTYIMSVVEDKNAHIIELQFAKKFETSNNNNLKIGPRRFFLNYYIYLTIFLNVY